MPSRAEIVAVFDAIAAEFDATRIRPWPETVAFEALLPRGARVLDLGCGNGRNLVFLEERGHAVVGLDASTGLLARSALKAGTRRLVRGDALALPFPSSTFDGVHCVAAVHHLPSEGDRHQCAREAARVLRRRGFLLLSAWALEQDRFHSTVEEHLRKGDEPAADVYVPWRRGDGRVFQRFYHLFRRGELDALVKGAGLAPERSWREGDNNVVFAAKS